MPVYDTGVSRDAVLAMAKTRFWPATPQGDGDPGESTIPADPSQIDGGGDAEHLIYVEQGADLVPYWAQYHRAWQISIDSVAYGHVGERDGRWVYRRV